MNKILKASIRLYRVLTLSTNDLYNLYLFCLCAFERSIASGLLGAGVLCGLVYFVAPARLALSPLLVMDTPRMLIVDGVVLSFQVTLISLAACLLAGMGARLLYLTRFVYRLTGWVGKSLFLGIPCLYFAAWMTQHWIPPLSTLKLCLLCIIPTAFLLPTCFDYTEKLMPEFATPLAWLWRAIQNSLAFYRKESPNTDQNHRMEDEADTDSIRQGEQEYAAFLGLKGAYTLLELRKCYHELAQQYHPDKVQSLGPKLRMTAEQEMKKINEAYFYLEQKYHAEGDNLERNR